jgi:hypothetical protein
MRAIEKSAHLVAFPPLFFRTPTQLRLVSGSMSHRCHIAAFGIVQDN